MSKLVICSEVSELFAKHKRSTNRHQPSYTNTHTHTHHIDYTTHQTYTHTHHTIHTQTEKPCTHMTYLPAYVRTYIHTNIYAYIQIYIQIILTQRSGQAYAHT